MKGVSGWSIFMVPYLTPRSDSFNASDSSSHLTVARFEPLLGAAADGDAILGRFLGRNAWAAIINFILIFSR